MCAILECNCISERLKGVSDIVIPIEKCNSKCEVIERTHQMACVGASVPPGPADDGVHVGSWVHEVAKLKVTDHGDTRVMRSIKQFRWCALDVSTNSPVMNLVNTSPFRPQAFFASSLLPDHNVLFEICAERMCQPLVHVRVVLQVSFVGENACASFFVF